ncbi:hypothetical protein PFLUV_G00277220 [Perca fluviatilis]|uniref:CARD domain-containing protein n=1 Tax=Perca fluviatilis TaxID=8168 RepID=A0A6A5DU58_PERFL|nr:hypothetical protein PFLUV_G00277220 [Perca fluviatilis]
MAAGPLYDIKCSEEAAVCQLHLPHCDIRDVHFRFSADADSLVSQKADFELEFGPNYHPTFEILLPINTPEVTLRVQDEGQSVWEHDVDMIAVRGEHPDPAEDRDPPEDRLLLVPRQFGEPVCDPVVNQLLDQLLERGVLTAGEMQSVRTGGADKGRDVMDTVRRKGRAASSVLVSGLWELDPVLSTELRLMGRTRLWRDLMRNLSKN